VPPKVEPPKPTPPKPVPPKPVLPKVEPPKPTPPKPIPPKVEPPKPTPPKLTPPKVEPPKPTPPKKQPEKPPEKPPEDADPLASVLSHVAQLKQPSKPTASPPSQTPPSPSAGGSPVNAARLSGPEEDALRSQIGHCWNVDPGVRNAHEMAVEITIEVNPDRTVARAEIVDKYRARMATDTAYRAAAEAALRAVKNPRCQPLALPPDKYDTWRRITFTFDPRDML
jgi:hypothetical protein